GRQLDGRSDLYSLGVVLYELLTGQLPFHGPADRLLQQVIHEEPQPPRNYVRTIPHDLETITLKCLAKDPDERYQTAAQLADDLQRWLEGKPIEARPVGWTGKAWRWCRRKPALAAASSLALVALLAASVVSVNLVVYRSNMVREKQL